MLKIAHAEESKEVDVYMQRKIIYFLIFKILQETKVNHRTVY